MDAFFLVWDLREEDKGKAEGLSTWGIAEAAMGVREANIDGLPEVVLRLETESERERESGRNKQVGRLLKRERAGGKWRKSGIRFFFAKLGSESLDQTTTDCGSMGQHGGLAEEEDGFALLSPVSSPTMTDFLLASLCEQPSPLLPTYL